MAIRPEVEVADVFRDYIGEYTRRYGGTLPPHIARTIDDILACRSAEIGGHAERCQNCGFLRISYNSCRNRNCPKCQYLKKQRWVCEKTKDVLPVQYFHLVFTVPEKLNLLIHRNQRTLYDLLMKCAGQTITELGKEPRYLGAKTGAISVLHTWGQKLQLHPHVHAIVPGGGLSFDGKDWVSCKQNFFMPVIVLSKRFRRKFLDGLKALYAQKKLYLGGAIQPLKQAAGFQALIDSVYALDWVVYAKPPFRNVDTVIAYLSGYTHRVAISNYRILKIENDRVFFHYRDYRAGNRRKVMSLPAVEFMRRFLQHVVPRRFVRIRYVGLLSNRTRQRNIDILRQILEVSPEDIPEVIEYSGFADFLLQLTGFDLTKCPACNGRMVTQGRIASKRYIRAP
jgi:hypothetical protein